jgi:DtxR family Mn-dependent transcriptional regulator
LIDQHYSHVLQRIVRDSDPVTLTEPQREYLAEVYHLQSASGDYVPTNLLAERLAVSPPAAVQMLRRLVCDGYLLREPYRGVILTALGEREALRCIRRHRILEAFLVQVMRFGWHEVHEQADALQPALTDALEERMFELAGRPTRCPHGDPIPTVDGQMPVLHDRSLAELAPNRAAVISRVRSHDPDRLKYLAEAGLLPGVTVRLLHRAPFNGPVRLQFQRQELVLGADLVQDIWVSAELGE